MSVKIGRFVFSSQPPKPVGDMALVMSTAAPWKSDVNVDILPGAQMPNIPGRTAKAAGYTPSATKIELRQNLRPHLMAKTLAHEGIHALCSQVNSEALQAACLNVLPAGWKWNARGYADDGGEVVACYGSAALFGVPYPPPYTEFYDYQVPRGDLDRLKAALTADYSGTPAEVDPSTPAPPAPDASDSQNQIDDMQAQIDQLTAALQSVQAERDSLAEKVANAKAALA